jgi:phosphopantetheine adenylyltransferase
VRVGAYPGSFNPPTVAHLTVAEAAVDQCRLDRVDLVISVVALGKEDHPDLAAIEARVEVLERIASTRPWLGVVTTESQLLVDIAVGYEVLVLGADKWAQLLDPSWYGGRAGRDAALARLPTVAVAPRPPHPLPRAGDTGDVDAVVLDTDPRHHDVSASAVRAGRVEWLAPDASHQAWQADRASGEEDRS